MVTFAVHFFTDELKKELKKKNIKAFGDSADEEIEIGTISCLHLVRPPIYVYTVNEMLDLIEAGLEVVGNKPPLKDQQEDGYPLQLVKTVTVEVDKSFSGKLYTDKKKSVTFQSKEQLAQLLNQFRQAKS